LLKQHGLRSCPATFPVPHRAINLMEALRRSIAEDKKAEVPRPAGAVPQRGVSLITLHWRYRREQIMALEQRRCASRDIASDMAAARWAGEPILAAPHSADAANGAVADFITEQARAISADQVLGKRRAQRAGGGGHPTTPAHPNADGGIDFRSRTVQVAGAFSLLGTRPTTRSATGRARALALASQLGRPSLGAWVVIGNWSSRTQNPRQSGGLGDGLNCSTPLLVWKLATMSHFDHGGFTR
jgi:hypothetical protein